MKYRFEQFDDGNLEHEQAAGEVSAWSKLTDSMLSLEPEDIEGHPYGILAFGESEKLLGYIAVVEAEEQAQVKKVRLGSLAVAEEYQGNGVGSALIAEIIKELPAVIPGVSEVYAYANPVSQRNFAANGFAAQGLRQPPAETGCNVIVGLHVQ